MENLALEKISTYKLDTPMNPKGMWYLLNSQMVRLSKLNHDMWFSSKGNFQEKETSMTLIDIFEVDESQEGASNPDQEDESDLLPSGSVPSSGSVPLGTDSKATFLRRSQHENIPIHRFEIEMEAFMSTPQEADEPKNYQETDEPKSYQEATKSPTSEEWKFAMQDEMESMTKNQIWDLVDLLPGHRTIGNK